jgi:hypothetical protein
MAISALELQRLYLAYFGRPADPGGMDYYLDPAANWSIFSDGAEVTVGFSQSPESIALYGAQFGEEQVRQIYRNLFNREAEPDGLAYWVGQVQSGEIQPAGAAYAILVGAKNEDAVAVANKLAIAQEFLAALDTDAERAAYAGNTAASLVRLLISSVDNTQASLDAARSDLPARVAGLLDLSDGGGVDMTLTTGLDRLFGSDHEDRFFANTSNAAPTFSSGDGINGGEGTDALLLEILAGGSQTTGRTVNVETIYVHNYSGSAESIDAGLFEGATHLLSRLSTAGLNFVGLRDGQIGGALNPTIESDLSFSWDLGTRAALLLGGSSTHLLSAGGNNLTETVIEFAGPSEGQELSLANLRILGAKNTLLTIETGNRAMDLAIESLFLAAADAEIRLTGDGTFTLAALDADLAKFDASGFEGERVEFDVGEGADLGAAFTYLGSTAEDVVHIRESFADAQLEGGGGEDTLVIHDVAQLAGLATVEGFETVQIELSGVVPDIDSLDLHGAKHLDIDSAAGFVMNGLRNADQLESIACKGEGPVEIRLHDRVLGDVEIDFSALTGSLVFDAEEGSQSGAQVQFKDSAGADIVTFSSGVVSVLYQGGEDEYTLGAIRDDFDFNAKKGRAAMGDGLVFNFGPVDSQSGGAGGVFDGHTHYSEQSTDTIRGIDAAESFSAAGTSFELVTFVAAPTFQHLDGFTYSSPQPVLEQAGGFALVIENDACYIFQDSNGNRSIEIADFMIRLVGTGNFTEEEFQVTEAGTLRYTSVAD